MGLFDRVERKLERVVNGAFAKAFRAEVQPVEIASAMRRAMDDRAAIVSKGRTLVPNDFAIELAGSDFDRLTSYEDMLTSELLASAQEHVETQRYAPGGPLRVRFSRSDDLETGVFRVRADTGRPRSGDADHRAQAAGHAPQQPPRRTHVPHPPEATAPAEGAVGLARRAAKSAEGAMHGTAAARAAQPPTPQPAPSPYEPHQHTDPEPPAQPAPPPAPPPPLADPASRPWLDVDGDTYPLLGALTVLGRDASADITLEDPGISRKHAEIRVTYDGPHLVISVRDLGSTNGTYVNSERIDSRRLAEGDRITVGRISLILRQPRR